MAFKFDKGTVAGVKNEFYGAMAEVPNIWRPFCKDLPASTKTENYAFPGTVPSPRELVNGRQLQGINQFSFQLRNKTYELSFMIDLETLEDDQTGLGMANVREIARGYAAFKNQLFVSLLTNGGTDTAFDGTAFFADTRVIGSSANIDNNFTSNITDPAVPTTAEFKAALIADRIVMSQYQDDKGRPKTDGLMDSMKILAPRGHESAIREALSAAIISQTSNVFTGWADPTFTSFLTGTDTFYMMLQSPDEMPFVYAERMPLSINVHDDPDDVQHNLGVLIETRERFVFGYGRPELCARHVYT